MMKKLILWLPAIIMMISCGRRSLSSSYYAAPAKTGIVVISYPMEHKASSNSYGGGLVGGLISQSLIPTDRYFKPFQIMQPQINPTAKIRNFYIEVFARKGKTVEPIEEKIDLYELKNYRPGHDGRKDYFTITCGDDDCIKDLRFLKEKYGFDEVMIVQVHYGIYSEFFYGAETARDGMASLKFHIVDLKDNSIIHESWAYKRTNTEGNFDSSPTYDNLKVGILNAIDEVMAEERDKYK